jgi:hypothetical protein
VTAPAIARVTDAESFAAWLRTAEAGPIAHLRSLGADGAFLDRTRAGASGLVPGVTITFADDAGKRRVIATGPKEAAAGTILFMVETILDALRARRRTEAWKFVLWSRRLFEAHDRFFYDDIAKEFRAEHNRRIAGGAKRVSVATLVLRNLLRNDPELTAEQVADQLEVADSVDGIEVQRRGQSFYFRSDIDDREATLSLASLPNAISRIRAKRRRARR